MRLPAIIVLLSIAIGCATPPAPIFARPAAKPIPLPSTSSVIEFVTPTARISVEMRFQAIDEDVIDRVVGLEPVDSFCSVGRLDWKDFLELARAGIPARISSGTTRYQRPRVETPPGVTVTLTRPVRSPYIGDYAVQGRELVPVTRTCETGVTMNLAASGYGDAFQLDADFVIRVEVDPRPTIEARAPEGRIEIPAVIESRFSRRFDLDPYDVGIIVVRRGADADPCICYFRAVSLDGEPVAKDFIRPR